MSVLTCGCQFKVILSILRKCMYIAHPDTCLCEFLAYVYLLIDCSILTWKEEPQPTLFDMKPPIRNQSWTVCQHSNWADIKHTPMEAQFKSTWPMLIPRGSTMLIYRPGLWGWACQPACGTHLCGLRGEICYGGSPSHHDGWLVVWNIFYFP